VLQSLFRNISVSMTLLLHAQIIFDMLIVMQLALALVVLAQPLQRASTTIIVTPGTCTEVKHHAACVGTPNSSDQVASPQHGTELSDEELIALLGPESGILTLAQIQANVRDSVTKQIAGRVLQPDVVEAVSDLSMQLAAACADAAADDGNVLLGELVCCLLLLLLNVVSGCEPISETCLLRSYGTRYSCHDISSHIHTSALFVPQCNATVYVCIQH
jgi:hypothetical protein